MENIFFLIQHNDIDKIKSLDLKKLINIKNYFGQTPLIFACDEGKGDIVRLLIDAGSDINHKDKFDYTALYYAERRNYLSIVTMLKSALNKN